jgi:hypothetical protein
MPIINGTIITPRSIFESLDIPMFLSILMHKGSLVGVLLYHYEIVWFIIEWFRTSLATKFLSCNDDLQLNVFLCHEYHQMNCMSYTRHNSSYVQLYTMQFHYNFTRTTFVQLQCNYCATIVATSCWCCISSIHDDELHSFLLWLFWNYTCV